MTQPAAPSSAIGAAAFDATEIARALDALAQVVTRLDSHLEEILERRPEPSPASVVVASDPAPIRKSELERDLDVVLTEIARFRTECDRMIAGWGGAAVTEEQRAVESGTHSALGKLRRRQASILFRLLELEQNDAADNFYAA